MPKRTRYSMIKAAKVAGSFIAATIIGFMLSQPYSIPGFDQAWIGISTLVAFACLVGLRSSSRVSRPGVAPLAWSGLRFLVLATVLVVPLQAPDASLSAIIQMYNAGMLALALPGLLLQLPSLRHS